MTATKATVEAKYKDGIITSGAVTHPKYPLYKLEVSKEIQPRANIDFETVRQYAELMRPDDDTPAVKSPPLIAFHGKEADSSRYKIWLSEGFHRFKAYEKASIGSAPVEIRKGDKRDAILFAAKSNTTHGLQRSNADKRRAVMILLQDKREARKSDQKIARVLCVSNTMVSNIRQELSEPAQPQLAEIAELPTQVSTVDTSSQTTAQGGVRGVHDAPEFKRGRAAPVKRGHTAVCDIEVVLNELATALDTATDRVGNNESYIRAVRDLMLQYVNELGSRAG